MTIPIGEIIDTIVIIICITFGVGVYSLYQPLVVIPILFFVYYWFFTPILSDSCCGYFVGSSRWETWRKGKREWGRF